MRPYPTRVARSVVSAVHGRAVRKRLNRSRCRSEEGHGQTRVDIRKPALDGERMAW